MTFCVGIKVRQGLLALADSKIVKGEEQLKRAKLSVSEVDGNSWWLMTSGLRSVRDKALTYLEQELARRETATTYLFELANKFGNQLRRVRDEDGGALAASNLAFNLHAVIGGQMAGDTEQKMYYIYPEGNWIESTEDSPYFIVGRTYFAKPILDRLLTGATPLREATALAFLAFDATRTCVNDVDYPIDLIVSDSMTRHSSQRRFEATELDALGRWWHATLASALVQFPFNYFDSLFQHLPDESSYRDE